MSYELYAKFPKLGEAEFHRVKTLWQDFDYVSAIARSVTDQGGVVEIRRAPERQAAR